MFNLHLYNKVENSARHHQYIGILFMRCKNVILSLNLYCNRGLWHHLFANSPGDLFIDFKGTKKGIVGTVNCYFFRGFTAEIK